ncbi:MAG: rhomboid family intramembrane serine protease [Acidobacteria bacterium]|nr:MAG: rhomboid family intramembrane serine protease [Acidobacteriota bacterium]
MLKRQTSGSVVCPSCGRLVGVNDQRCFSCGRWNPGLWGYAPLLTKLGGDAGFAQLVTIGCAVLYLVTLLLDPSRIRLPDKPSLGALFGFLSPGLPQLFLFGASGAQPVFGYQRWWTVLSASWLHGSLLHVALNLYYVRIFAPHVEARFGFGRLVIIYTAASAAGFGLTSVAGLLPLPGLLAGAPFTVGASAPLFGLLGALVVGGSRAQVQQVVQVIVILGVIGFLGGLGIDNWAHLGGFAGGYFTARWLNPWRPETQGHVLAALGCLALTAAAILLSIVTGLRYLG